VARGEGGGIKIPLVHGSTASRKLGGRGVVSRVKCCVGHGREIRSDILNPVGGSVGISHGPSGNPRVISASFVTFLG
jgi:hypothetical protein